MCDGGGAKHKERESTERDGKATRREIRGGTRRVELQRVSSSEGEGREGRIVFRAPQGSTRGSRGEEEEAHTVHKALTRAERSELR